MRNAARSRDRLLAAAAREFAAHGYEGGSVDRIAHAARLNKAMIYYHFKSKAGLYRTVVRAVFAAVLETAVGVAESAHSPAEKIRLFVRSIGEVASRQPHFPAIWLREFSMGARHLDQPTLQVAARVVQTLERILEEGCQQGAFRPASPVLVQIGIVAPILIYLVSDPTREKLARAHAPGARGLTLEQVIEHVTQSTLGSLCLTGEKHA